MDKQICNHVKLKYITSACFSRHLILIYRNTYFYKEITVKKRCRNLRTPVACEDKLIAWRNRILRLLTEAIRRTTAIINCFTIVIITVSIDDT